MYIFLTPAFGRDAAKVVFDPQLAASRKLHLQTLGSLISNSLSEAGKS
jgi:hypothetical protein